jgi:hypothetical protein
MRVRPTHYTTVEKRKISPGEALFIQLHSGVGEMNGEINEELDGKTLPQCAPPMPRFIIQVVPLGGTQSLSRIFLALGRVEGRGSWLTHKMRVAYISQKLR